MDGVEIILDNLGPLRHAELKPGRFTIVCGENNTGKTYATYALFGFLHFWHNAFSIPVRDEDVETLIHQGTLSLDLGELLQQSDSFLAKASEKFSQNLASVFAADKAAFANASVQVRVAQDKIKPLSPFERVLNFGGTNILGIVLDVDSNKIVFSLLAEKKEMPHKIVVQSIIGQVVRDILFGNVLPRPFIASVERTGAAVFRTELDITRNRLLETMASQGSKELDLFDLLNKTYSSYAWPVKENVDFVRELEKYKESSEISKNHPMIMERFQEIAGGGFEVRNSILAFIPSTKRGLKLGVNESSSSVRSLLHLGFYLKHLARPGDLLMIDEPELNLHPKNQRLMARLLAILCNVGVNIFVTTHSDYIIRELNTLLLLHGDEFHLKNIRDKYKYDYIEAISVESINLYIVGESILKLEGQQRGRKIKTLIQVPVDKQRGIEVSTFDESIQEMNQIQDEILYGG